MGAIQRLFSLSLLPIIAILALQIFSPQTFRSFQDTIQPYIVGTPLSHFFPDILPPRSETPVIIASISHWSHLEKIAAIAVEIATLGYPVTFMTGKVFEKHILSLHPNIKFSALLGKEDKLSEEDMKKWASMSGEEQDLFAMKAVFLDPMPDYYGSVQAQFQEFRKNYGNKKPLIYLYDQAFTGIHAVTLGAPGIAPDADIGISIQPLTLESNDTFPFRSGKIPHTGPDAKGVHYKAYQEFNEAYINKKVDDYWWENLRRLGATQDPLPRFLHSLNSLPEHVITLGIPEFEFPRSDIRKDIRYFGAFKKVGKSEDAKVLKLPSWWDDIATAKKDGKKIIAVSQGTVAPNLQDIVLPTLEALKDRDDVLVIASTVVMEPEEVPGLVVPDNARVAKFVPYDLLLPLVDLLVSNGGYGAVQHCLRLGIPMIVSGIAQDKATTNSIVQWAGVGIDLGVSQPGAERIGEAVEKVLVTNGYKKKAMAMSKFYDNYDVTKVLEGLMEDVVRDWMKQPAIGRDEL